jgi:hypothetical protein
MEGLGISYIAPVLNIAKSMNFLRILKFNLSSSGSGITSMYTSTKMLYPAATNQKMVWLMQ